MIYMGKVIYEKLVINNIVELYSSGLTIKEISKLCNICRVNISRILKNEGVNVVKKTKPFSEEHRNNISKGLMGKKNSLGIKRTKMNNYKNMKNHLLFDVDLDWLCLFDDINKLKFLNKIVSNIRKHNKNEYWETDFYKKFIEKFYYDDKFNKIYNIWLDTKDSWKKPSIDHINCDNRSNDLNNFQFLTWFENRCKNNIPQSKWIKMKENINEYFI
jgi:hypothetical protein